MFVRNQWYCAALSREVEDAPVGRIFLNDFFFLIVFAFGLHRPTHRRKRVGGFGFEMVEAARVQQRLHALIANHTLHLQNGALIEYQFLDIGGFLLLSGATFTFAFRLGLAAIFRHRWLPTIQRRVISGL